MCIWFASFEEKTSFFLVDLSFFGDLFFYSAPKKKRNTLLRFLNIWSLTL